MLVHIEIKYEMGHSVSENWESTKLFCPNCGHQKVWVEHSDGDYYLGPQHLCLGCRFGFSMPNLGEAKSPDDVQRFERLLNSLAVESGKSKEYERISQSLCAFPR